MPRGPLTALSEQWAAVSTVSELSKIPPQKGLDVNGKPVLKNKDK